MKFFMKKNIFKNIVIVLLAFIVFGFVFAKPVEAGFAGWAAGKLFDPIMDFLVGIGDLLINFLQQVIIGQDQAIIPVDRTTDWIAVIAGIVVAIVIIVVAIATGPAGIAAAIASAIGALASAGFAGIVTYAIVYEMLPDTFYLTNIVISPQEIFTNQVAMLDVNFINPHSNSEYQLTSQIPQPDNKKDTNTDANKDDSIASQLRETIASWYTSLRNITLVGLMIVLLYVGIRILLSSVASEKAKYKQMIKDWVVALCILFFLHYIMAFSITIVEQITKGFASMLGTYIDPKELEGKTADEQAGIIADKMSKSILTVANISDDKVREVVEKLNEEADGYYEKAGILGDGNEVNWIIGNSMSQARINYQLKDDEGNVVLGNKGWGVAYLGLVVFTIYFMFVYLKRVVYMAFLTMIAPLIALTYPIDKISDGQAQAFNTWLKEFLFNLLLQPMHLILYTVLIGSAMQLAAKNVLYVIVAFAFMVPAEKLMRKFFGFEKASTAGALGGAAGAALVMSGMKKLSSIGKNNDSDSDKSNSEKGSNSKEVRQRDNFDEFDALSDGNNSDSVANQPPRMIDNSQNVSENNQNGSENQNNSEGANSSPNNNLGNSNRANPVRNNNRGGYLTPLRPKRERKIIKGIGRAMRHRQAEMQKRYTNKGGLKGTMSRLGKRSLGLMAGATAATALGIASFATGDPSKILSNMAAGASTGYALGKNAPGKIKNTMGMSGSVEAFKKGYYGDEEYDFRKEEKMLKDLKKNMEFTNKLYDKYDKKTVQEMLRDHGEVDQLFGYGLENPDDIMAAHELISSGTVKNAKQAAATARMAKRVGDYDSYKQKDREDWEKTLKKEFSERVGEANADKLTTDTIARIRQFNDIKYRK